MYDDVRVVGCDYREYDENFDKVMCKFEVYGLIFDYEKCVIWVKSMVYMGELFMGEGL